MFSMILEEGFEELDETALLNVNGGACTGSSSGGCTSYSGGSSSGSSSSSTVYSGECTGVAITSGGCTYIRESVPLAYVSGGMAFPLGDEWNDSFQVTSEYGERDIIYIDGKETSSYHNGIDIAAKLGTRINTVGDGVVSNIGYSESLGNYIEIKHSNGTSTRYCHCDSIYGLIGSTVSAGERIATVGTTGLPTEIGRASCRERV